MFFSIYHSELWFDDQISFFSNTVYFLRELVMHGCVISPVVTDALVLKHQAIRTHSADQIQAALDQFNKKCLLSKGWGDENIQHRWPNMVYIGNG